ncbi:MAG: ferritin-like domain-containing protein [Methylophilaceae bacterium]
MKACYLESIELRQAALNWLVSDHPLRKAEGVINLQKAGLANQLTLNSEIVLFTHDHLPGRPANPRLVPPKDLKKRSMRSIEGRAALIHALAHIEFNAINLALDAIWRFTNMPNQYYLDWLKVAAEEAYHFSLLNAHLHTLGFAYGSFNAHNSLWEMVERTQEDVLARMALVPRTLEAHGLDASPPLRNKLAQAGDMAAAEILTIILRDEIGHVAIGNYWFNWLCKQRDLDPISAYQALANQYAAPKLKPPFNLEARREAGFSESELSLLV